MSRPPSDRTIVLGVLLVVAGSFLRSVIRPPWWSEDRIAPWIGPSSHFGLFTYDYLVLGILLVTVAAVLYADTGDGGRPALLVGGLSILATRGWFVWEEFLNDYAHSGVVLGLSVPVSVIGAALLLVAGYRGLRSDAEP